jgi:hypothetical protein
MNFSLRGTDGDAAGVADACVTDVTERLVAEFDDVDVSTVSRTVLGCGPDLRGAPIGALPELIERLARQRLLEAAAETACAASRSPAPPPDLPSDQSGPAGTHVSAGAGPHRRARRRAA